MYYLNRYFSSMTFLTEPAWVKRSAHRDHGVVLYPSAVPDPVSVRRTEDQALAPYMGFLLYGEEPSSLTKADQERLKQVIVVLSLLADSRAHGWLFEQTTSSQASDSCSRTRSVKKVVESLQDTTNWVLRTTLAKVPRRLSYPGWDYSVNLSEVLAKYLDLPAESRVRHLIDLYSLADTHFLHIGRVYPNVNLRLGMLYVVFENLMNDALGPTGTERCPQCGHTHKTQREQLEAYVRTFGWGEEGTELGIKIFDALRRTRNAFFHRAQLNLSKNDYELMTKMFGSSFDIHQDLAHTGGRLIAGYSAAWILRSLLLQRLKVRLTPAEPFPR